MDMSEQGHLALYNQAKPPFGSYRYLIGSRPVSPKYSVCEVCCTRINGDLHFQAEERYFNSEEGWTRINNLSLYGHEKCLRAFRHESAYSVLPL